MRKRIQLGLILNFLLVHIATMIASVEPQKVPVASVLLASRPQLSCNKHQRQASLDDTASDCGLSEATTPTPFFPKSSDQSLAPNVTLACCQLLRQLSESGMSSSECGTRYSECGTRCSDCGTRYSDKGVAVASSRDSLTAFFDKSGNPIVYLDSPLPASSAQEARRSSSEFIRIDTPIEQK